MLKHITFSIIILGSLILSSSCDEVIIDPDNTLPTYPIISREEKLPNDIDKRGPDSDAHPPVLHSTEYQLPIPLPRQINTSGAEDSPFILPDGNTLYFFFTPDVRIKPEKQLLDSVTGIWISQKNGKTWSNPERVWLQEPGKLALDGAVSIQNKEMWFASAREGYTGVNMFTAESVNGEWINWKHTGNRLMEEIRIGEVHLHGDDLYFHSDRPGSKGELDIWITTRNGQSWSNPINIESVNTITLEGFPFISSDGQELWFTRTYLGTPAIFKSIKINDIWTEPQLMISQFAGEPTLDDAGNLYFVHHYYENGVMIEADIYVAYKK